MLSKNCKFNELLYFRRQLEKLGHFSEDHLVAFQNFNWSLTVPLVSIWAFPLAQFALLTKPNRVCCTLFFFSLKPENSEVVLLHFSINLNNTINDISLKAFI